MGVRSAPALEALCVRESYVYVYSGAGRELAILRPALQPLGIVQHPRDSGVRVGQTANFRGHAVSRSPLSFQWQKDGQDLRDDSRVTGSITPQLTITDAINPDTGAYRFVVSNEFGVLISSNALLRVDTGSQNSPKRLMPR